MLMTLKYACPPFHFSFIVSDLMIATFGAAMVFGRSFLIDVTSNIQYDFLLGSFCSIHLLSLNKKKSIVLSLAQENKL